MSFTGVSNLQATQISGLTADRNAINAALDTKLATATYTAKVALLDAVDNQHTADIASLEANKVNLSTYNAKIAALDLLDATHDNDIQALQSTAATKVAIDDFNAAVADLEAADANLQVGVTTLQNRATTLENRANDLEANTGSLDLRATQLETRATDLEGRATQLETRATALETDISNRVQAEIDDKVAQATFDALATELRDADSALSQALATKVATTVQQQTDDAQNALINSKVAQTDYDAYVASNNAAVASKVDQTTYDATVASVTSALDARVLTSTYDAKMTALDTRDANLENRDYHWERRFLAVDEFIRTMLLTYTVTKPDGQPYVWTFSNQQLPAGNHFAILGKRANGNLVVQLSPWAYGNFIGNLRVLNVTGTQVASITVNNVNPTSRIADLVPTQAIGEADFALTLQLRDSRNGSIFSTGLTLAQFNSLSVLP